MELWQTLSIAALAAAVFWALGVYASFRAVFGRRKERDVRDRKKPPDAGMIPYLPSLFLAIERCERLPSQPVSTVSRDCIRLGARCYLPRTAPRGVVLLFHGYHALPINCFGPILEFYLRRGWAALLVSQRGHTGSGGRYITFGVMERWDCVSWAEYARERFGPEVPVVAEGVSMGAATVLMASNLGLPENVRGIVADCGYTSPRDIIRTVIRRSCHLPPALVYPPLRLACRLLGGFDPDAASAREALKSARVPVLFIHGEADRFVPCVMSRENYDACTAPKTLYTVPRAAHAFSWPVSPQGVLGTLEKFLRGLGV